MQRLIQREVDPVTALHPGAIIAITRRLEAGLHRQQVLDRNPRLAGVRAELLGEEVGDRLIDTFEMSLRDCDAD